MTLLEATTTLIDFARTNGQEEDKILARAIKRMDKRLEVLKLRDLQYEKRARSKAFWDCMSLFKGGASGSPLVACFFCPACKEPIFFGDFLGNAEWSRGGRLISLVCPHCKTLVERPA